jgi:hypothetical protein
MSAELPFPDEPTPLQAFEVFKASRPEIKPALIKAARAIKQAFEVECDIHTAYGLAAELYGLTCGRDWLPAFAREIEAETELRFKTRPSRFDGLEPLLFKEGNLPHD